MTTTAPLPPVCTEANSGAPWFFDFDVCRCDDPASFPA